MERAPDAPAESLGNRLMLQGTTLLAGDSMTVGLAPFVKIDGEIRTIAAVGRTAAQLLEALQASSATEGAKNLIVLIGANDIGGAPSVDRIFQTIADTWSFGKRQGMKVFALTIPPNKGWAGFASNFPAVNSRRKAINAKILASHIPDQIVDLDRLTADPSDPDALSKTFDSGDHLHPRKDALGALLTKILAAGPGTVVSPTSAQDVVASGVQIPVGTIALAAALVFGLRAATRTRFYKRTFA